MFKLETKAYSCSSRFISYLLTTFDRQMSIIKNFDLLNTFTLRDDGTCGELSFFFNSGILIHILAGNKAQSCNQVKHLLTYTQRYPSETDIFWFFIITVLLLCQ